MDFMVRGRLDWIGLDLTCKWDEDWVGLLAIRRIEFFRLSILCTLLNKIKQTIKSVETRKKKKAN